ncbi:gluconate 2-dehydrogenase subunit 3 family protein [Rummeliibacillus sp. JY-2-4R]
MSEQNKKNEFLDKNLSRRTFLKSSGLTVGSLVIGGAIGSLLGLDSKKSANEKIPTTAATHNSTENPNVALMYFTHDQFSITEAATERIFPADANGPGAKELLVAYYIDHQLVGPWGLRSKEYTKGPFYPGEDTQGYQGRLNRQQIFNIGLEGLQTQSLKKYKKKFPDLTNEEQDAVLTDFADDKVKLNGISAKTFFGILRGATLEGAYADPLYGGNKNMAGWKMKNFPGHQMSYLNIIDKDFAKIKPAALNSQHNH